MRIFSEKRLNLPEKRQKAKEIIKLVNEYFSVDCNTPERNRDVMLPRQIAIYLICENIVIGTAEIGKIFLSRRNKHLDHATIIHNREKIKGYLFINDKEVVKHIEKLKIKANLISKMTTEELIVYNLKQDILLALDNYNLLELKEFLNNIKNEKELIKQVKTLIE